MGSVIVLIRGPKDTDSTVCGKHIKLQITAQRAVATPQGGDFSLEACDELYYLCGKAGVDFEVVQKEGEEGHEIHLKIPSRLPAGPGMIIRGLSCLFSWIIDPSPKGHHEFSKPELEMLLQGKPLALGAS